MSNVSPLRRFADGLANVLTGRGTSVDRNTHRFWHFMQMPPQQLEAAYRTSWLIGRIVDLPPMDMVREWREWETESDDVKKIEAEEKRLGVISTLWLGLVYGRLGGGVVIIGSDADMTTEAKPTDKITYLKALTRWSITLGPANWEVNNGPIGEPSYFTLNGSQARDQVHPSRVIVFKGELVPDLLGLRGDDQYWGDSIIQRVDTAVKDADTATAGFSALIDEAKVDVFKLAKLAETLVQVGGDEKVRKRIDLATAEKSAHRSITLDAEDEWETRQITWAGMPEIIRTYLSIAAGAAEIPATRLLGKSPDGMNATGEGDEKNYRATIKTKQNMMLRPALDKLDAQMLPALSVAVDTPWTFSPLDTPTDKEMADIAKVKAETAQIDATSGLIPTSALEKGRQSQLVEDGTYPGLAEALKEAPDITEPGDDIDESETGIVPIGAKGGGQVSRGGGGPIGSAPLRRAANDARFTDAVPRTLYVRRDVVNVADLKAWAKSQGLPDLQGGLHVTIAHIDQAFDWMKVEGEWTQSDTGEMTIQPGGVRIVEALGNRTAVLLFTSSPLSWRHESILRTAEAQDRFPMYQPHISLTGDPVELEGIEPYRGKIVLGPEIFEEVST